MLESFYNLIEHEYPFGGQVTSVLKSLHYQNSTKLSKSEGKKLDLLLTNISKNKQIGGVDFSRAQLCEILTARDNGQTIEFETLGPYLADYIHSGGEMTRVNLISEDAVGLALASTLRYFLPTARLVSLYDEYNEAKQNTLVQNSLPPEYTITQINTFKRSLIELLVSSYAISKGAQPDNDYLLIPESSKVKDAMELVEKLQAKGFIIRNGEEISFFNPIAENPLYRTVRLRTKQGRWLCEALDASAFLKPLNQNITHLVVLPSYMKSQQDKVWEILRVLGILPQRYHNIFYDPTMSAAHAAHIVFSAFIAAEKRLTTATCTKDSLYAWTQTETF